MANPYMRDALLEQMDPTATTPDSQNKLGWNRPITRNPATAPVTDPTPAPTSSAYTDMTNRTPSPSLDLSGDTRMLDGGTPDPEPSPWAGVPATPAAGALEGAAAANAANAATATTGDPGASAAATAPTTYANAGQNTYAGFNTQRAQDPSKSAKDAFYAATQQAPPMPKDKAGSEVWFNQYIKKALEDKGYKVYSVQGDKAVVGTTENPSGEEIDFNQGADSDASSVAWQSNMADGGAGGGTSTGSAGANTAQLNSVLSNPDVMSQINSQIEALMKQGMTMEQIMALFNTPQSGTGA